MLCLTRRPNETVRIGDDVEIVIISVKGNHVRIGINAPMQVKIVRGELGLDANKPVDPDFVA